MRCARTRVVWRRIWDFAAEPSSGRLKGAGFISLKMTEMVDRGMVGGCQAAYRVSFIEETRYNAWMQHE